jgi:PIN domain nuclease of toxin-antitoxin system
VSLLLLDTHAWLWLAAGDRRLARHERTMNQASTAGEVLLSAASVYEAALIGLETDAGRRRGRQAVRMRPTVQGFIRDAIVGTGVIVAPVEGDVALDAAMLHALHADPFDRMIVATAMRAGARLVTADAEIATFARAAGVALLDV